MKTIPGLSDDDGTSLIGATLRMYVGNSPHHVMTFPELAELTGEKEGTLRSYVERDPPRMSAPMMMRVFSVLPPEAWARINHRMGFAAPGPLEVDQMASVRRAITVASQFVAEGTAALEDGELDHRERASLARGAEDLIPKLAIVAGGRTN
jgi:hypothetical protein